MNTHYDFIIIGSGPAGQKAAITAAKFGKRTAIIERKQVLGGNCLHVGTVPSKTLREAALYLSGSTMRPLYGRNYRVKKDITMQDLLFRTNSVIQKELQVIHEHMNRYHIDVFYGHARFVNDSSIVVENPSEQITLSAEYFIIATGTVAYRPDYIPFNEHTVIDSDQLYQMSELPRKMTIIGAGVIGIEYASIFSILDVEVTIVSRSAHFFGFIDQELTDQLTYHLQKNAINLLMNEDIDHIEYNSDNKPVLYVQSGKAIQSDVVMVASGRSGTAQELQLENAGIVATERGLLEVDPRFSTSVKHIFAAGDIIGFPSLASTSQEQGRQAVRFALGKEKDTRELYFPYGIYSIPEIAYVGKTEEELREAGIRFEIGKAKYREIAKGEILEDDTGLLKILVDPTDRKILGVHIIGTGATELIHIGQAVMKLGATVDYFLETVFNYPTLAECYKIAAINVDSKL